MTELLLKRELEPLVNQQRRLQRLRKLTMLWGGGALTVLLLIALARAGVTSHLGWWIGAAALVMAVFLIRIYENQPAPDYRQLARDIEQRKPDLHALLLTAVEQERDPATGRLSYLQDRVINEAVGEVRKQESLEAVPRRQMRFAQFLHAAAAIALLITLFDSMRPGGRAAATSVATAEATASSTRLSVTPGNANIERGSGLVVLAKFEGAVPGEATLVITSNGAPEARIAATKNLNDPVFGASIPEVQGPLTYRVEYEGGRSEEFKVTVYEHPRLERADAQITYPEYTGLEPKRIQDTRRVSAVEGSIVNVDLQLNKAVRTARLVGKDKSVLTLEAETNRAQAHLTGFRFETSQTYELQLIDSDGRSNKLAAQFVFEVLTNQRPTLKIVTPRGDQRVSPLQEVTFQGEALDDFGLRNYGLTYSVGGAETKNVVLGESAPARVKTNFTHLLKLEDLRVEPDQLVSYYIWAEDIGPDGQLRRTASDMFFAEIRPFEEIFRQGESMDSQNQQQQQQQQQQRQSESARLAELQKQIINATWKLQRQETGAKPSAQYLKDEPVVLESQERALSMAESMEERLQDYRMKEFVQLAQRHMETAVEHLAAATNSPAPLPKALAAEQAAYQALMKLQAREFQVVQMRNQQRGGQQQNSPQRQAQLDQLEMKQEQDRYETQREASAPQSPEQQEQLGVLNRLKELAQRQQDINERLKELQTALQEARTEKEREELRRELKRLREEQREMLADMDALRQQMERAQNQEQMADAQRQLEQARQNAQQASEALEQGSVSQALASGTRAERELEQMRDDFRNRNSSQFAEDMRQMRNDARELAEKQEDIAKKMESLNDQPKSLSDSGESKELATKLAEQKQGLTNLLTQMKRVTEQAENAEPLLSKQLYDSLRKNSQGNLDQSLSAAQELVSRNFLREAQPFEQRARTEIETLKSDVEKAAESVLGNETEALRMAKRELDELTEQLQRELQRAAGGNPGGTNGNMAGTGEQSGTNALASAGGDTNRNAVARGVASTNQMNGTNLLAGSVNGSSNRVARGAQSGRSNDLASAVQPSSRDGNRQQQQTTADGQQQANANGSSQNQQGQQSQQSQQAQNGQAGQQGQQGQQGEGQQGQQAQNAQGQNQQQAQSGQQGQPGQQGQQQAQNAQGQQQGEGQGQGQGQQQQQAQQPGQQQNQQQANAQQPGQGRGQGRRGDRINELLQQPGQQANRRQGGGEDGAGVLTGGDEFTAWNDRLSNVEEMIDQPDLRNQVAQARDRARAARAEFKRHAKSPQWDFVHNEILKPLVEVRDRVADELSRRDSSDSLAPIDRDPVPGKYGELVRRYYETLGNSK